MEDFCAPLGLRPAAKYESTWERIAKAVRDHVPVANRSEAFRQMATLLLLSYALRNADCHAKNLALRYTHHNDVHLAPAYDLITTAAYPDYAKHPPAIAFMGRKTWDPGKSLPTFITATFGVSMRDQVEIVEQISAAMAAVGPLVRAAMIEHPGFSDIGKRMLHCWREGLAGLRDQRCYAGGNIELGQPFAGLSAPADPTGKRKSIGRSELLGRR